jgi:hypothetical protein
MTDHTDEPTVKIDNVEYKLNDLSDDAKVQLSNLQFVDDQLQQFNNEWAVADTARIAYTNALKTDLARVNDSEKT